MGWLQEKLSRGKKFLEKTPQKEYLELKDLQPWLEGHKQRIVTETQLKEITATYVQQLQAKRWHLEMKCEEWNSLLKEYNREQSKELRSFLTEVQALIALLTFPDQASVELVAEQSAELEKQLQDLKALLDRYSEEGVSLVLSDGREAEQVIFTPFIKEMMDLDEYQKAFDQKIVQARLKTLVMLQEKSQQLKSATQTLQRLQEKLNVLHQRAELSDVKRQEKQKELDQWKLHPSFGLFQRLEQQRKILKQEIVHHQDKVVAFFNSLKSVLPEAKIFVSQPLLLDQYVHDPESAFFHDEGLMILSQLQEVRSLALEQGKLSLPLEAIPPFCEKVVLAESGYLQQLRQQQQELQHRGVSIAPSPDERQTILMMEDTQYRLEHFAEQVVQVQQQCKEIEKQITELFEQREKEKDLLQHIIKMGLGKEVEVKL